MAALASGTPFSASINGAQSSASSYASSACFYYIGKRFKPAFDSDRRARFLFLLVRSVYIFRFGERFRGVERGGEFVRPLALQLDRRLYLLLALYESFQVLVAVGQFAYDLIVGRAVHFLAVTRDKRHGVALIQKVDDIGAMLRV